MQGHHHSSVPSRNATQGHVIHWAPVYEMIFGRMLRRTHGTVVDLAAPIAGEHVLDVCCGSGGLAVTLKSAVGSTGAVYGIDASPEMIAEAQRKARTQGIELDLKVGLAEALPFPPESFDVVVSQLAIHHLPGELKQRVIAEMFRVLKSDGRCLIVDFEPPKTSLGRSVARVFLGAEMMRTDVRDYCALMEAAGFRNVEAGQTRHRMLAFVRGRVVR